MKTFFNYVTITTFSIWFILQILNTYNNKIMQNQTYTSFVLKIILIIIN